MATAAAIPVMGDKPDDEILRRMRAGETELYEVLMHRYTGQIQKVARRILPNQADVEDVVQEAHLKAVTHIDQFAGRSSFVTWLTRITIHRAMARLRRQRRSLELNTDPAPVDRLSSVLNSTSADPERQLLDKELRQILQ